VTTGGSRPRRRPADHLQVDVVVVGGGIAGVSAGWALARGGATVALVEREAQLGHHATGRSAALLNQTVGPRGLEELVAASAAFLTKPSRGFCEYPLLSPRGLLWIGRGDQQAALDAVAAQAPAGAARRIGTAELARLVPRLKAEWSRAGGVLEQSAQHVDVDGLLQAYARGLRAGGGRVFAGLEAVRLEARHGRWVVRAGDGELAAEFVVNAAGAWGDVVAERAGVTALGLQAYRRTACLVPAPADTASWPLLMDVAGGFYAEPESGGLLVSPADETLCAPVDARPEEIDVALCLDRLNEALDLQVRHVRRAWAGLRTFAPDRLPVVGIDPDTPGFVWLVGQGGAGIKTAPALASIVAADILGAAVPPSLGRASVRLRPERLR
jgi:D-arginine dehydrogenase